MVLPRTDDLSINTAVDVDKICKGYIDRNNIKMLMDHDEGHHTRPDTTEVGREGSRTDNDTPALELKGGGIVASKVLQTHYNIEDDDEDGAAAAVSAPAKPKAANPEDLYAYELKIAKTGAETVKYQPELQTTVLRSLNLDADLKCQDLYDMS